MSRYHPGVDGLRAVAVLAVLLFHTDPSHPLAGGFTGVDVFFVISGYLITRQLLRPTISLKRFLARRLARLWPALLVLVAAIGAEAALTKGVSLGLLYAATYSINIAIAHHWGPNAPALISHTWSLAIEVQFYVGWGIALVFLAGAAGRRNRWILALAIAVAVGSLALRGIYATALHDAALAYFSTESRLDALFIGVAIAAFAAEDVNRLKPLAFGMPAVLMLSIVFITARFASLAGLLVASPVAAVSTALLLSAVLVRPDQHIVRVLASPPIAALGKRSYSLYLWHFPVFELVYYHAHLLGFARVIAQWTLAFVAGEASFRLVETPARRTLYRVIAQD